MAGVDDVLFAGPEILVVDRTERGEQQEAVPFDCQQEQALARKHSAHAALNADVQTRVARQVAAGLDQNRLPDSRQRQDIAQCRGGKRDFSGAGFGREGRAEERLTADGALQCTEDPAPDIWASSLIVGDMLIIAPDSAMIDSPRSSDITARLNDG